tara:strand:- start:218 stop:376 length:159 start_codon:yes stop_codon:yes gene_type:complete
VRLWVEIAPNRPRLLGNRENERPGGKDQDERANFVSIGDEEAQFDDTTGAGA